MASPWKQAAAEWYALTVKPRHEKSVARNLADQRLESYLPLYNAVRRWSDRKKIVPTCLFPGYVFCRFGYSRRMEVLRLPSVTSIVGFGDSPAPVPARELDAVRIILSSGQPASPWPFLKAGQKVRISQGSLRGVEGILVREKDAWRVVVSVELLQRSVAVEIDRDMLRPV